MWFLRQKLGGLRSAHRPAGIRIRPVRPVATGSGTVTLGARKPPTARMPHSRPPNHRLCSVVHLKRGPRDKTSVRAGRSAPGRCSRGRPARGWWVAGAAVLLVVVVVAALVVRSISGAVLDGPEPPGTDPTPQSCPRSSQTDSSVSPSTGDRVRSGQLSYPRLPAPFGGPMPDDRTPFAHDVQTQHALVEQSPDGETIWVAWALIARLMAGDGFYGPEQGAEIVAGCVVALFYNNHEIQRSDTRREAITVDGHEAYLIESHPDLRHPWHQDQGRDHDRGGHRRGPAGRGPGCSTPRSRTPHHNSWPRSAARSPICRSADAAAESAIG